MTTFPLKHLTTAILVAPLLAAAAQPVTEVHTRFGTVGIARNAGPVQLLVAGKPLATIDAASAALIPWAATSGPAYIAVQTLRADPACKHAYLMLEVSEQGATVSKEFGRCRHLAGSGMSGSEPVLHLSDPDQRQGGVDSYQWHAGEVTLIAESPSLCSAAGFLAQKNAQPLSAPPPSRVAGSGRLQFLSAPDPGCAMPGVFVVPGDSLSTSLASGDYVYANYTNPKSGRKVQGWVPRARLADQ